MNPAPDQLDEIARRAVAGEQIEAHEIADVAIAAAITDLADLDDAFDTGAIPRDVYYRRCAELERDGKTRADDGHRRTIAITQRTFRRLQRFGTGFTGSERGTPDKALNAVLDTIDAMVGTIAERLAAAIAGIEDTDRRARDAERAEVRAAWLQQRSRHEAIADELQKIADTPIAMIPAGHHHGDDDATAGTLEHNMRAKGGETE